MYYNKKSAFTLVELVVVMAIIAVLLAISAYGIALVFRNSRNSQRAQFINNLKVGMEKYYANYGTYPESDKFCYSGDTIHIKAPSATSTTFVEVKLDRGAFLLPSAATNSNQSRYCYHKETTNGLYSLQYEMETQSGTSWSSQLGTEPTTCSSSILSISNC